MDYDLRALTIQDEAFMWEMARVASRQPSIESVKAQPDLARYVSGWGRSGDLGYVAALAQTRVLIGTAWLRLWTPENQGYGYLADDIPELAIAVIPQYQGKGIGTALLTRLLAAAEGNFPAVSLSVRADNRAIALYRRAGFEIVPNSEVVNRTGGGSFNMVRCL